MFDFSSLAGLFGGMGGAGAAGAAMPPPDMSAAFGAFGGPAAGTLMQPPPMGGGGMGAVPPGLMLDQGQGLGAAGNAMFGSAPPSVNQSAATSQKAGLMDQLNSQMAMSLMQGMSQPEEPGPPPPAAPSGPLNNPAALQALMQSMQGGSLRAAPMPRRF